MVHAFFTDRDRGRRGGGKKCQHANACLLPCLPAHFWEGGTECNVCQDGEVEGRVVVVACPLSTFYKVVCGRTSPQGKSSQTLWREGMEQCLCLALPPNRKACLFLPQQPQSSSPSSNPCSVCVHVWCVYVSHGNNSDR